MKSSWWYVVVLATLAPLSAEIVNGSTPLSHLVSAPVPTIVFILLPYSFLIIILCWLSQKTSRAGMIFLLPIAGLVIEGLGTHSFFDPSFPALANLAGVAMAGGVQWVWTISLVASHMMTSFIIPLTLALIIVPAGKVSKRVFVCALIGLGLLLTVGTIFSTSMATHSMLPHLGVDIVGVLVVIFILIFLSQKVRLPESHHESIGAGWFFILGFLFPILNWFSSFFLAREIGGATVIVELVFLSLYVYFLWSQWLNDKTSDRKRLLFIIGYILPALLVLIFHLH